MTHTLSPAQAGQIAQKARLYLRQGKLTHAQHSLLTVMLWGARKPGSATLAASLPILARLAGQARSTVVLGVDALERLGLLQRIKRRVRVAWMGVTASRQIANAYVLMALDTGSDSQPGKEQPSVISILETPIGAARAAQKVLAERRRAMEARLLLKDT
jgi:hypothetical protein